MMFGNLKKWLDVPISVKSFTGRSGTGAPSYATAADVLCYPDATSIVVTNNEGVEVTSDTQLYVDGNTSIKELDEVTFNGKSYIVKSVGAFYRSGKIDIKVVYI